MINIVCVLQINPYSYVRYSLDYVQKLQRGFQRNLSVPHKFYCFSNIEIEGVDVIPLKKELWWGHWAKMEIFTPGILKGPTIYSDIDALLCKNVDSLTTTKDNLVMIRDYYPHIYNSTLMYFNSSDPIYTELYQHMCNNEEHIKGHYEWSGHNKNHGDQALIYDFVKSKNRHIDMWDEILPAEMFMQFSGGKGLMMSAAAWDYKSPVAYAYCMGRPKFHQVTHLPIVYENWI